MKAKVRDIRVDALNMQGDTGPYFAVGMRKLIGRIVEVREINHPCKDSVVYFGGDNIYYYWKKEWLDFDYDKVPAPVPTPVSVPVPVTLPKNLFTQEVKVLSITIGE